MINIGAVRLRVLACLLAIFVFLGFAPVVAFAEPASAYEVFKTPLYSKAELSPSGRYLATVRSRTERVCVDSYERVKVGREQKCKEKHKQYRASYFIQLVDLEGGEDPVFLPIPHDHFVSWLDWASEDRLLVKIRRRTTTNDGATRISYGGSRVFSVRRDGSDMVLMFGDSSGIERSNFYLSNVVNFLRHDPQHILMAAKKGGDLDLFKLNIETGKEERIAIGKRGTFKWYTDKQGKPILRFDYDRTGTKVLVYSWSDEAGKWEKIRTARLKQRNNEEVYDFFPVAPTNISNQIYVISDEDDDPRRAVKIFDLKENRYVKTVFEHSSVDVGGVVRSLSTGDYAGVWYYEDRLHFELIDKDLQAHIDALNVFFEHKENVDLVGFNETGTQVVLFVSGPKNPGAYYLYNFEKRDIQALMSRRPELEGRSMGDMEAFDVPMRDGTLIRGYLTHPATGPDPEAPLVVMPHGGPEARDYFDYDPWVQFLAARGYQVLQVNFRGSDGYGRAFARAGYGQWGGLMQDDVTDAVKFLHDNNRAPADRTCIFGYSYGGYAALMGGVKTPELYQCIIAGGAVTDLIYDLRETRSYYGGASEVYDYWSESIGSLSKDSKHLKEISPVNNADRLQAPVFLFHGTLDSNVDFVQATRMVRAMKRAKVEHQFIELKGEGHSGWSLENDIMLWSEIEAFLAKTIGPGASDAPSAQGE